MKRALLADLTVCRDYLRQLVPTIAIVCLFLVVGMQTIVPVPGTILLMGMFMFTISASAYDDLNGWGLWRATTPLSRTDVVLGRYACCLVVGALMAVLGAAICALMAVAGALAPLPEAVAGALSLEASDLSALACAIGLCFLVAAVVAGISLPVYFRLGSTAATQRLPFVFLAVAVAPLLLVNMLGPEALGWLEQALVFLETPEGLAAGVAVMVGAGLAVLAASAAVSVRLYATREL